jgi:hypothetical protein
MFCGGWCFIVLYDSVGFFNKWNLKNWFLTQICKSDLVEKKLFISFSSSFLTLVAARWRYLKHEGTKSNCFYIVILIDILKTSSNGLFGPFWAFFPKETVIFTFFQGWPIIFQKIWPTYSKIQVLLYDFTLFYDMWPYTPSYFDLENFLCKNWHEN